MLNLIRYKNEIATLAYRKPNSPHDFTYELISGQYIKILKYIGTREHIIIPEKINGYNVKDIGDRAFADLNGDNGSISLKSIVIPAKVDVLRGYVFLNCTKLSAVKFKTPHIVTDYSIGAFQNTRALKAIALPEYFGGGGRIAYYMFAGSGIESFTLSKNYTYINPYAFYGCPNLSALSNLYPLWYIYDKAFRECPKLFTATLSQSCVYYTNGANASFDEQVVIRRI